MPCSLQQNPKCCYCIHCPDSTCHLLKAHSSMYIQQFDNLFQLVLPVQYASSCIAAFSRIQSFVNVFIVLSQLVICLKPSSLYIQPFDNLFQLVLPVQYASSCVAAFSRIQSFVNVFIVLSQVFLCLKPTV